MPQATYRGFVSISKARHWWLALLILMVGCRVRTADSSAVLVANGVETLAHPEVVLLINMSTAAICSGTFVSPSVLVTASHCFKQRDGADISFDGHRPVGAFHGAFVGDPAALRADDLAVLRFDQDVAPAVATLASESPQAGAAVEMVGFGRLHSQQSSTSGVKRAGINQVAAVGDGFIVVEGLDAPRAGVAPGEQAVGARGDSGGPLFSQGLLVGVDTGGGPTSPGKKRSLYVDLTSSSSLQILCEALRGGAHVEGFTTVRCDP